MKNLLLLLVTFWSVALWSQSKGIPNRYMNDPAVDLTRAGKLLMPDEVHDLLRSSRGRFDISTLNPSESSDLWKNVYLPTLPTSTNPLIDLDEVSYHSPVLSPSGIFRFNIKNPNENGKLYTMMLSKTVHSILLARSLLKKIGYQIPDIKHLPRVFVNFKSEEEKKSFVSYLEHVAFAGAPKNWIVEDLGPTKLLLQDLIIMESNHTIYNLAVGVNSDMIQGRRLLSSLAVPLTIVNLTESVNLLRWNAGVENNNQIMLFHDGLEEFQCSWDDARWISRRIERLTRADWEEIVESSNLPKSVQMILVEKLISRRNSIMKLFKVDAKNLPVDGDVSNGVELVDGKLTQQHWPGYASRFSFGDPNSPLAASEMRSWIKSRAISAGIEIALAQVNQLRYLGTNIDGINKELFKKNLITATQQSIADGTPREIPLRAWAFPTVRGQLLLSRNLVTGTYLGTDNLVQLVDTVGVAIAGGVFVGTMGLPTPFKAFARAEAAFMRSYSHLRPVTSIEKALKYSFKNVLVPLVQHDLGRKLHEAAVAIADAGTQEEVRQQKIEAAIKPFKDAVEVGESIIITDSLSKVAGLQAGVGFDNALRASVAVNPNHIIVSRFHVHRKSADEFHIYKDFGRNGAIQVAFGLQSYVPVLKLSYKRGRGEAEVKYFNLNLSNKNPEIIENISHLRRAMISSSTRDMEEDEDHKPYVIRHKFRESTPGLNLFFWQWKRQNASTDIKITHPKGDVRYFRRNYLGHTRGRNYHAYANGLVAHWIEMLFQKEAGLSESTGSNPGYSYKGRAHTKIMTLDQEVSEDGTMIEPFVRISRIWNGWSINSRKARDLLSEMQQKYRFEFYNAPVLNDTRQIFLYNLSVNMLFYRAGIENVLAMDEAEIIQIYRRNKSQKHLTINPAEVSERDSGVRKFLSYLRKYRDYEARGNDKKSSEVLLKAFSHAEDNLTLMGVAELVGGVENFFVSSRIDGFREGDEDGDRSIIGSSLGEFGSPMILGPIVQVQRQSEMLEGEFFIYWMMTRLI